ncbi:helix-turn-helix domain-containing protein [Halomonas sp. M4R5S39]|uniref:helix-turn-helix domain-containing protein n=1 Tax=Halomonas kalidii TaxID=3043293 RepID=UPI0024A89B6E|nr:helix-turn-helix domain-containing protein [Halomonas kalidii]MDI5987029.1 helix-turn-helix domain-containing protein [Halomonas kalidii]
MSTDMKKPGVETRANSNTIAIDPTTHAGRILAALRERPMSNIEIIWQLNIAHPPAAVRDLRQAGVRIDTEPHPHPSRPGEKIKRYHLVGEG